MIYMSSYTSSEELFLIEYGMEELLLEENELINLEEKPALTNNEY